MSERLRSFLNKEIPRREFLKGTVKTADGAMAVGALYELNSTIARLTSPQGLALGEPISLRGKPAVDEAERLSSKTFRLARTPEEEQPKTIKTFAHRAGNTPGGIERTAKAKIRVADFDVVEIDDGLFVSHSWFFDFLGIHIGYDKEGGRLGRIKVGKPYELEQIFEESAKWEVDLSGELKRGNFREKHLNEIVDLSEKYGVHSYIHAQNHELVDMGRRISGKPFDWQDVPVNMTDWKRIFKSIESGEQIGILTNESSVKIFADRIRDSFVIVGNVDKQKIQDTIRLGVVNGYMTDLPIWESILDEAA